MKKIIYKAKAYRKGKTGRKGEVWGELEYNNMSDAIKKIQDWVYLHEDLYYYSIEREIIIENEQL